MKKRIMIVMVACLTGLIIFGLTGCKNAEKEVLNDKDFEQTIEEKLNNIVHTKDSSVLTSSNPYDYIKGSYEDYKYIVSQGKESLNYMLSMFAKSSKDGLKEYVMAVACSEILEGKPVSKNWASGREWYNGYLFSELLNRLSDKGVTKEMLTHLFNTGLTEEEIAQLSKEEIDRLCAPGTQWDGYGFDPSEEQIEELKKVGIDSSMSIILFNLGYGYEDMKKLSAKEIDFIFPNTELIANLAEKGITQDKIDSILREGKTYKDVIGEALN